MSNSDWLMWQLSDSAFPCGAFAHSGGLEAAWQCGHLTDGAALQMFLYSALHQAAHAAAPFVAAVHREPGRLGEWDTFYDVTLSNHVANRASRAQGRAMVRVVSGVFIAPTVTTLVRDIRSSGGPAHFAPVFGAICQALGIELESAIRLFLFQTLRGLVSAAVRLGLIGPLDGQSIQWQLTGDLEKLVSLAMQLPAEDSTQTSPLLDLMQGTQDRLYSRLFQS